MAVEITTFDRDVIEYLAYNSGSTSSDVASGLRVTTSVANRSLSKLARNKIINKRGSKYSLRRSRRSSRRDDGFNVDDYLQLMGAAVFGAVALSIVSSALK